MDEQNKPDTQPEQPESIKTKTIEALATTRQQIVFAATSMPAEKREIVFIGEWSIKDLLAHLVGWDYANIQAIHDIRSGEAPRVLQHWSPDWKVFNARLVKEYKQDNWDELLASLTWSEANLMRLLTALPEEEYQFDFGVRNQRGRVITIAQHLRAEIEDEREHYEQIVKWMQTWM